MLVCAACAVAQRRRVLWLAAIVAGIASGGAGCARRETPVQAGIRTQTLHVGLQTEPATLDPHLTLRSPL